MSNVAYELMAVLGLDSTPFDQGMNNAMQSVASGGSGIKNILGTIAETAVDVASKAFNAVADFGKSSIEVGAQFDASMSQVAATMGRNSDLMIEYNGESVKSIDALREFAKEMGSSTAFSASQASDALNYMALAGYNATESMEMLPNVLNLAAAGSMDLASSSDMLTDASSALGLTFDESAKLVNQMATTASSSNTSIAQLGEAILTVGGTAKNLKGGTTELATALGILADNGIKGSEGGTALRNMLLSLSSPTDKATGLLEKMGVEVYDAQGNLRSLNDVFGDLNGALSTMTQQERTNALSEIFNKVDLKSANALLAGTTSEFYNLAHQEMELGSITDDLGEKVSIADYLMANYDMSATDLADVMRRVGDESEFAEQMLNEFGVSGEESEEIWKVLGGVVDSTGNRFDELSSAIEDCGDSATEMANKQLDNLSGDLVIFNSAVEGAQIALSDKLTPALRGVVQFGTEAVSSLTKAFDSNGIEGFFGEIPNVVKSAVEKISAVLPDAVANGIELTKSIVSGFSSALPSVIDAAKSIGIILLDQIKEYAPKMIEVGLLQVQQLGQGLVDGIPAMLESVMPQILELSTWLRENAGSFVDAGIDFMINLVDGLIAGFPTLIETMPQIISNIAGIINDNAPKIMMAGGAILTHIITGIVQSIPLLVDNAGNIVKAIVDVMMTFNWLNLGSHLIEGIESGIKMLLDTPKEAIVKMTEKIVQAVKSVDWPTVGKWMLSKILDGINALISKPVDAIKSMISNVKSKFDEFDWKKLGSDLLSLISNGVNSLVGEPVRLIGGMVDSLIKTVTGTDWLGTGKRILDGIISGVQSLISQPLLLFQGMVANTSNTVRSFDWVGLGGNILNGILSGILSLINRPVETFNTLVQNLKGTFGNFDWIGIGRNVVDGIVNGLLATGSKIKDTLSNLAQTAYNKVKNFFGISSPSRKMKNEIGKHIPTGLALGIEEESTSVYSSMKGLAIKAVDAFEDNYKSPDLKAIVDGDLSGIGQTLPIDFETSLIDTILSWNQKELERVKKSDSANNVTINLTVNASNNMDVKELADEVMDRIQRAVQMKKEVFG